MNFPIYPYLLVGSITLLVVLSIASLLFYKKALYLSFILNFTLSAVIALIELLRQLGILNSFISMKTVEMILLLVPPVYGFTLSKHFQMIRDPRMVSVFIITIVGYAAYFMFPSGAVNIIAVSHLYAYFFLSLSVRTGRGAGVNRAIIILHVILGIFQTFTIAFGNVIISAALYQCVGIALLVYVSILYRFRISSLVEQYNTVTELNRKFSHTISRLKVSNEQCRKILLEKELELFQIARHASLAELTAGIAHELSQPLTGIKLIAQNMVDDINYEEFDPLRGVSDLLKICTLVDKSTTIINHIRNFSKKTVSTMKMLDINRVLLDAIELIGPQLKKNNIDLVYVFDDTVPKIIGDKISLEQLVINIILNAKDAILKRRETVQEQIGTVRISSSKEEDSVKVIIEDDGIGIPEIMIQKIWSPFYTTKKRDHGTGIGLSISNKILKDHNVKVDVQSSPSGSNFIFLFPVSSPLGEMPGNQQ